MNCQSVSADGLPVDRVPGAGDSSLGLQYITRAANNRDSLTKQRRNDDGKALIGERSAGGGSIHIVTRRPPASLGPRLVLEP